MTLHTTRGARAVALACGAGLAASLSVVGFSPAAHADDPTPPLVVNYDASGTSYIAKTKNTITLGPTVLTTSLNAADGSFTGHLPLPGTTTSFKAAGLLPTTAIVGFKEAAPVTGNLVFDADTGTTSVTSTASYYITLRHIKVLGLPVFEGPRCQTTAPVSIPANTPAGQVFDLSNGGTLSGTYTIGKFAHCGISTGLLNLLVPGGGNTVSLNVSNGQVQE